MALKKATTTRAGGQVEYWKIMVLHHDLNNKWIEITIVPFISESTRELYAPVSEEAIMVHSDISLNQQQYEAYFSTAAMSATTENMTQIAYRFIKTEIEEFAGAEDC